MTCNMTAAHYEISCRLVAVDSSPERWRGCAVERHVAGKRPHRTRLDEFYPPRDSFDDGYAPDITQPWAFGVMLAWLASLGPGELAWDWTVVPAVGQPHASLGEALASAILARLGCPEAGT